MSAQKQYEAELARIAKQQREKYGKLRKSYSKKYGERSPEEYAQIEAAKQEGKTRDYITYMQSQQQEKKKFAYTQKQQAYQQSKTGKVSRGISSAFGFLRSPTRALYTKPSYVTGVAGKGQRGRPVGTKKAIYAPYGGVYGWRKAPAQQRALQRIRTQSSAGLNPEEQALIQKIKAQQMASRANPEAAVTPTTEGYINMAGFMKEIDDAAGLVD